MRKILLNRELFDNIPCCWQWSYTLLFWFNSEAALSFCIINTKWLNVAWSISSSTAPLLMMEMMTRPFKSFRKCLMWVSTTECLLLPLLSLLLLLWHQSRRLLLPCCIWLKYCCPLLRRRTMDILWSHEPALQLWIVLQKRGSIALLHLLLLLLFHPLLLLPDWLWQESEGGHCPCHVRQEYLHQQCWRNWKDSYYKGDGNALHCRRQEGCLCQPHWYHSSEPGWRNQCLQYEQLLEVQEVSVLIALQCYLFFWGHQANILVCAFRNVSLISAFSVIACRELELWLFKKSGLS